MGPKFCGQCGERVGVELKFCERCGNRLGAAPLPAPTPSPEIPKTRLGMKMPVLPTIPMPPSSPGIEPTPQPWSPAPSAAPRRRRWPWVLLGLFAFFVGSAVAGWFAAPVVTHGFVARFGLPTGVGDAEVLAAPTPEHEDAPEFDIQLASLTSSPPDHTLATPIYRIEPRGEVEGPFEIALPLFDPDDARDVVVGHFHDGAWEPLATEVVDGRAIAVTDTFSHFAGWNPEHFATDRPGQSVASYRVSPPRVLYGEVASDGPAIVFDLRGQRHARAEHWGALARVASLRVEVNQPEGDHPMPRQNRFARYVFDGAELSWTPSEGTGRLRVSAIPLSRVYDHQTQVRYRRWQVRVVPVYADGTVGPASEYVDVYPDVLRAYAAMNREAPFDPAQRAGFDARVAAHPLTVVYGGYVGMRDAYNGSLAWSRRRGWGRLFGGVAGPNIGMTLDATYGDVVTHEWGHYAAHMALGDSYENESPGGAHRGWVASTRALAFTEDLATLLGQWATGVGVPANAGAMFGRTRAMSRTPEGDHGPYWPNHRAQDAVAVETVSATALSRLAHEIGFAQVFATIAADPPSDLIAFFGACPPPVQQSLQPILIDEGVSWRLEGRVVVVPPDGSPPTPVEGATVHVRTLAGAELVTPELDRPGLQPTTGADGRFSVRVPPGEVELSAEKAGFTQRARVTFSADSAATTNSAAQTMPADIELEPGLSVVIESPLAAAVVTERILVVTGRVERREGMVIETVTLTTAGGDVQVPLQADRFEGRVTLAPGDNTITATARSGDATGSATVTVRANITATVLMCELTWTRNGTDVDLWVTDPEGVTTGFTNRTPREGRQLDVDNTRGFGPETYTMSRDVPGSYEVRVNYFGGSDPVGFRVRWCIREATPQARCDERSGTLTESDHNGSTPGANHRFTVVVPPP